MIIATVLNGMMMLILILYDTELYYKILTLSSFAIYISSLSTLIKYKIKKFLN